MGAVGRRLAVMDVVARPERVLTSIFNTLEVPARRAPHQLLPTWPFQLEVLACGAHGNPALSRQGRREAVADFWKRDCQTSVRAELF